MAQRDDSNDARLQVLEVHKNGGTLVESRTTGAITGQLQSVSATANSVVVHDLSYQYGAFGNLATQAVSYDNGSSTVSFAYGASQLRPFYPIKPESEPLLLNYRQ